MKRLLFALAALAAGCTLASSAPAAAARNYDCSKPGNANKAACKQSAKPAKAAPAPKAKEAKAAAPKASKETKSAAAPKAASKPAAKPAAKPASKPAAMPKATPKAAPATSSSENNVAAGAIAQCKDGTYSHAKNHRGACSRHGGVGKWMG